VRVGKLRWFALSSCLIPQPLHHDQVLGFINNVNILSDPETWVSQHGDAMYRYALMRLNNPAVAEDLVQETFLAALKARDNFAGKSSEKTWLIGILKHKIIDYFRKNSREQPVEDINTEADRQDEFFDEEGHWNTTFGVWNRPNEALEQKEFWQIFSSCISDLPAHLADLYILREINGMQTDEVCKVLNISTTNNLWVMLSRARMRIRRCLEAHWFNAT